MRIRLLGPVSVTNAGVEVDLPSRQVRRLLTLLAATPGRPVPVDRLLRGIWGDDPPGTAVNTLQVHVSALRRAIGRDRIRTADDGYALDVPPDAVDLIVYAQTVDQADQAWQRSQLARARDLYAQALALWEAPPFPDATDPVLRAERTRWMERHEAAQEQLLACRLDLSRDPVEAAAVAADARALVGLAPLRERRIGLLVRALAVTGRPLDATRAYLEGVARLREDLGVDPSQALRDVHARVLRQERSLLPATWRSLYAVPAPFTVLVGRDAEVNQICSAVLAGDRMLTITGSGGVGKTRLAQEVAHRLRGDLPGGVVFAELAQGAGLGDVIDIVAATLRIRLQPEARRDGVVEALRGRPVLLVLDDTERQPAAGGRAVELLRALPNLTVLTTGRRALGVAGEQVVTLAGLACPLPDATAEILWSAPAVRLFVERATAAGARLDDSAAASIARLCHRFDGIPLALELVAAHAAEHPITELENWGSLALVSQARHDGTGRRRGLTDAIDASLVLTDDATRTLLMRTADLPGGVTPALAGAVLGDAGAGAASLSRALEWHLVAPMAGEDPRARMAEVLRERVSELIGEPERQQARQALRRSLAGLRSAVGMGPEPMPARAADGRRLRDEMANLRAALAWPEEFEAPEVRADLALLVAAGALLYGWHAEAMDQVEAALESVGMPVAHRLDLLTCLGLLHYSRGRLGRAERAYQDARTLAQQVGDESREIGSAVRLAGCRWERGDPAAALETLDTVTERLRVGCDEGVVLLARRIRLAIMASDRPAEVGEHFRSAVAAATADPAPVRGHTALVGYAAEHFAVYGPEPDARTAITFIDAAAADWEDPTMSGLARLCEGRALMTGHDPSGALSPAIAAAEVFRGSGSSRLLGNALILLAEVLLALGDAEDAAEVVGAAAETIPAEERADSRGLSALRAALATALGAQAQTLAAPGRGVDDVLRDVRAARLA